MLGGGTSLCLSLYKSIQTRRRGITISGFILFLGILEHICTMTEMTGAKTNFTLGKDVLFVLSKQQTLFFYH